MSDKTGCNFFQLSTENDLKSKKYDGILLVSTPNQEIRYQQLSDAIASASKYDPTLNTEVAILPIPDLPAGRLIHAPTGPLDFDFDDVRCLRDAAVKGVKRAIKAKIKCLLLVLPKHPQFEKAELVTLLAVLEALYVPIQLRELDPSQRSKLTTLGVLADDEKRTKSVLQLAQALNNGRSIARDIGDADPERMAPPKIKEYVKNVFANTNVSVKIIDDIKTITKEYPLFEAVNRGASLVERHRGNITFLEYNPPDPSKVKETLLLVGKGVTYDTGGADIKAGGIMAGMSRDKCGAAAVAGFMKIVDELKPTDIRVISGLSLVRNSVGSNCYVSDELIKARSGTRVRVGNTDAEGRMVMADVLCKLKEVALDAVNPHLFTVATLTGHAFLTVGEGYSIVMDNGPARKAGHSQKLQDAAHEIGDPFEISSIRREDLSFHRGIAEGDDIMQCNNAPSSRTPRGHQGPAAFLLLASGLDKHGSGSEKPLRYSHLDIAASAGNFPKPATGSPVLALANMFLLK